MSRLLVADRQSILKDVSSSTLHFEWERGPADVLSLSVLSGFPFYPQQDLNRSFRFFRKDAATV